MMNTTKEVVFDLDAAAFSSDDFRMYQFKVKRCPRARPHDWTQCPFAHPGEKAKRRDPRRYRYSGTACPEFRRNGCCRRGDACPFAHGVFECWLHPSRYRTQMCTDGSSCKRRVCFFAHTDNELRKPEEDPVWLQQQLHAELQAEQQVQQQIQAFKMFSTAISQNENGPNATSSHNPGLDSELLKGSQSGTLSAALSSLMANNQSSSPPRSNSESSFSLEDKLRSLLPQLTAAAASSSTANNASTNSLLIQLIGMLDKQQQQPPLQQQQQQQQHPPQSQSHSSQHSGFRASLGDQQMSGNSMQPSDLQKLAAQLLGSQMGGQPQQAGSAQDSLQARLASLAKSSMPEPKPVAAVTPSGNSGPNLDILSLLAAQENLSAGSRTAQNGNNQLAAMLQALGLPPGDYGQVQSAPQPPVQQQQPQQQQQLSQVDDLAALLARLSPGQGQAQSHMPPQIKPEVQNLPSRSSVSNTSAPMPDTASLLAALFGSSAAPAPMPSSSLPTTSSQMEGMLASMLAGMQGGFPPLQMGMEGGQREVEEMLLKHGADVNKSDKDASGRAQQEMLSGPLGDGSDGGAGDSGPLPTALVTPPSSVAPSVAATPIKQDAGSHQGLQQGGSASMGAAGGDERLLLDMLMRMSGGSGGFGSEAESPGPINGAAALLESLAMLAGEHREEMK